MWNHMSVVFIFLVLAVECMEQNGLYESRKNVMLKNVNILPTLSLLNYEHFHAHEHLASHQHSLSKYHVIDMNSYACRHLFSFWGKVFGAKRAFMISS